MTFIAKRLRWLRLRAGFQSQRSLAIRAGVPQGRYNQHESGKRRITPDRMVRVLDVCLSSDDLPQWLLAIEWDIFLSRLPKGAVQGRAVLDAVGERWVTGRMTRDDWARLEATMEAINGTVQD